MSTLKLLTTIWDVVSNRKPRYKKLLPTGEVDLNNHKGSVLGKLNKPIPKRKPSPATTLLKHTATIKVHQDFRLAEFVDTNGQTLESDCNGEILANACYKGLDMETVQFEGATLCDALMHTSDYHDRPLAFFKFFETRERIYAVDPEPVFYGLNRAPGQTTGVMPMVQILSSSSPDTVDKIQYQTRQNHFFKKRCKDWTVRGLLGYPKTISLRDLRYRLKFGQCVTPAYTFEWYRYYASNPNFSGFDGLRTAFADNSRYDSARGWDDECERLYQRIMTTLEICRCCEVAPVKDQDKPHLFLDNWTSPFAVQCRKACGEFSHWNCQDPICGLFRDCPNSMQTMQYNKNEC